jgi:1,2-diacylglycerol 3-beta-galactosyltransferase
VLQVLIVDMWKEHTPEPWSTMPDSYSFLVKHGMLWRLAYTSIQPRMIHVPYFAAMRAFIGRHLAEAFDR